jgi:Flp pilus assembly protein TadD
MNRIRFLGAAALALIAAQAPAFAQGEVVAQPNPDADRLANDIRMLASDPRDVRTLLDAGMTSARLGDTSAALAFFQRAEVVAPGDPRIAAGRGMALVRLERPGEALKLFQEAEARGVNPREYAADRAFAYDLLGQPALAQRDYKLALSVDRDDETIRRYALSQGITGDREEAMRTLEPLLRRSDRAAWRARAFILAMNGDTAGAEKIAASMMPGTMGQALSPFFRRLATLGPADRAFAVHFGELSPTQARIADARMAPELPRYVPAAKPPVQVAAVTPAPAPVPAGRDRRSRKDRERDEKLAAIAAARQPIAPAPQPQPDADLPPPPRFVQPAQAIVQPIPAPKREEEPTEVAERKPTPAPVRVAAAPPPRAVPAPTPAPTPAPAPLTLARAEPVVVRPAPRPEPTPPGPAKVGQEDSVLAAIVGGITIPAEELATVTATPTDPVPVSTPEPEPAPVRVAEAKPAPAPPKPKPEPVAAKPDTKKPDPKAKPDPADAKKGAKPDPADAKKGTKADPKAKKPDPKKPDPAKADPSRIWVQVAGGANADSLAKAWKAVVAKAPAAMKGKGAWTTPLRATNRVLAGPFKTAAEAQAFVNTLGKAGISGFVFTSEAGQKVTKLAL